MAPAFTIRGLFRFGWEKTRQNSGLVFKAILIFVGVSIAQGIARAAIHNPLAMGLVVLAADLAEIAVSAGLIAISLKLSRGEPSSLRDLVPPFRTVLRYLLALLAAGLIVVLSMLLPLGIGIGIFIAFPSPRLGLATLAVICIAAGVLIGIYLGVRYSLVRVAAIDRKDSISGILRTSMRLTRGFVWKIVLFSIVAALLNTLGAILFLVGLILTMPITIFAFTRLYLILEERSATDPAAAN